MKLSRKRVMQVAMPLTMSTLMTLFMSYTHLPEGERFGPFWLSIWSMACPVAILLVQVVRPAVSHVIERLAQRTGIELI
ncbi:DUF2798 domain-containing protein [Paenirhodobacter enshiensis]|uniref:DUF2798 domain-containing protein n=1 Tax=Paenirhodobacter enshiensis TaxID=1105367 RepID=A0A086Y1E4_9RHOB|nr:DUF2798 domain-containing protein [Paenirhodobacter enshiensis]KFI28094.1 hypothetical protein CG50_14370 [Paenirhodobacter enshiensis]